MQFPKLAIVRQSSFRATPWKNGGGITHEALRMPAGGDDFQWRVSVAHIDASGPFSDFAAYNRKMVLLRGAGIDLRFANGEHRALRQVGELAEFDGAVSAYCELVNGPCVDLNLMVEKGLRADARVARMMESLAVSALGEETTLVFPLGDPIVLTVASGEKATLEPWDLGIVSRCTARLSRIESGLWPAPAFVFLANIGRAGADPG